MKNIQLFIVEEHHEAFWVWNYAIINKLISQHNNTLLHVDQHSDMAVPKFNCSIKSLTDDLLNIYKFTYNELTIDNFIVAAIYQGIFSHVYWLYQTNNEQRENQKSILVYSHKEEGKILKTKRNCDLGSLAFFNPDFKNAQFQARKTLDEFPESQAVVLDIDLDYFSCNPLGYQHKGEVQVTKEQYDLFNNDKYHFLRLAFGSGIKTKVEEGKYYLSFNSSQPEAITEKQKKLKVSEEEIVQRINTLGDWLINKQVEPQLIDICRSRLSGFTPDEQCEFIEKKLIEKLNSIYNLEINQITEVLAKENLELVDQEN